MKTKQYYLLLLVLFLVPPALYGAEWFCRPITGEYGAEDGSDWANAFDGFADINWAGMSAGDDLYISGGASGATYAETMTIGKSGTSGNPITIYTGAAHATLSASHDGLVTITGAAGANFGVNGNSKDYITIDGNDGSTGSYTNANIFIHGTGNTAIYWLNCTCIKILYVYVDSTGANNGINITQCDGGSEIGYCRIERAYQDNLKLGYKSPTDFGMQSVHDCLIANVLDDLATCDGGVNIYNNTWGPWSDVDYGAGTGHPDGIQMYDGKNRVYDNVFQAGDFIVDGTNALLYITSAGDTDTADSIFVYNNLFYCYGESYTEERFFGICIDDDNWGMDEIIIANNTFVDIGSNAIILYTTTAEYTNVAIENNLIHNCKLVGDAAITALVGIDYANSSIDINNNIISEGTTGSIKIAWNNVTYTVAAFNALSGQDGLVDPGGGRTNIQDSPTFSDYTAAAGSSNDLDLSTDDTVAKEAGLDLSGYTNFDVTWPDDYDGTARPQSTNWDIGAYEPASPAANTSTKSAASGAFNLQ